jgi:glycine betaine catabolism B
MDLTLTLIDHKQESSDVESFIFRPDPAFDFIPGQYLRYILDHNNPDDRGTSRLFSIASAPCEGIVQITTKFAPQSSSFKTALRNLHPGGQLNASGPSGSFTYSDPTQPVVFIAGGIGITPFRSILVELDHQNIDAPIILIYSNRTTDIVFKELFDTLVSNHHQLKVIYVVGEPSQDWQGETGRVNPDIISKYVPDLMSPTYYISGPKPMVEGVEQMLTEMSIPPDHIKHDYFPGYTWP